MREKFRKKSKYWVFHVNGEWYSYILVKDSVMYLKRSYAEDGVFSTVRPLISPSLIHKGGKPVKIRK